jgi:chromosome partitioning protein
VTASTSRSSPTEGLLTLNALVAADEVWAAVVPAPAEIGGLPRLEQLVTKVAARLNPNLAISAVIPCRYDARKRLYAEGLAILLERYGDRVTTRVPAAVRVEESISASEPIGTFDRLSPADASEFGGQHPPRRGSRALRPGRRIAT